MKDRAEQKRFEKDAEKRLTLNTKLILVIAGSLLLAVVLFFIWLKTTVYVIDKKYLNETTAARRTEEKIDRFSDYVSKNKVKSTDMNAILSWQREEGSVYLLVYQNENVIYDSTKQKRRTMMERFFNKISNGNQKGRKLAESEEDKRQMLNNIKSKHLLEIYRKKADSKNRKNDQIRVSSMIRPLRRRIIQRRYHPMLRMWKILHPSMAVMHFIRFVLKMDYMMSAS